MKVMQNYEYYQSYPLQENIGNSLFYQLKQTHQLRILSIH
jgi:hypothetical protein